MKNQTLLKTEQLSPRENLEDPKLSRSSIYNYVQHTSATRLDRSKYLQEFTDMGYNKNPAYKRFLERNWLGVYKDLSSCMVSGELYKGKKCSHTWLRATRCKKTKFCYNCATHEQKSRVARYMELINMLSEKIPGLHVIAYELTFPRKFWDLLAWDYKKIRFLEREFFKCLGFDVPRVHNVHVWHSEHPGKGVFPHVHGVIICLDKHFQKTDYYHDLDLWREAWKLVIETNLGEFGSKKTNLHSQYHRVETRRKKIYNRLEYMFRLPCIDVSGMSNEEFNHSDHDYLNSLLWGVKGGKTVQTFGWISDGTKNRYLSKIGLHHVTRSEHQEVLKKTDPDYTRCPVCGCEGEIIDYCHVNDITDFTVIIGGSDH